MASNLDYTEIDVFDYTAYNWTNMDGSAITPVFQIPSYYSPGRYVNAVKFTSDHGIKLTFANPIDIHLFSELAFWYFSQYYTGPLLTLGLGKNSPDEYIHIIQIKRGGTWAQDTWDISGIPSNTLSSIKYITIESTVTTDPTNVPIVIALDEMVARTVNRIESVGRALEDVLNNQLTVQVDNAPFLVPARSRTQEENVEVEPVFLWHLNALVFDAYNEGRAQGRRIKRELQRSGSFFNWLITDYRRPVLVNAQVDIFTKYELHRFTMQEFLIRTLEPRGALRVSGDVIDFIQIGEPLNQDTEANEVREFRTIYNFSLMTWIDSKNYTVPAVASVDYTFQQYADYAVDALIDAGLSNTLTPDAARESQTAPQIRKHPDVYAHEDIQPG